MYIKKSFRNYITAYSPPKLWLIIIIIIIITIIIISSSSSSSGGRDKLLQYS